MWCVLCAIAWGLVLGACGCVGFCVLLLGVGVGVGCFLVLVLGFELWVHAPWAMSYGVLVLGSGFLEFGLEFEFGLVWVLSLSNLTLSLNFSLGLGLMGLVVWVCF
jgi:hypothetical protein